jgi:hypothetical protein
MSFNSLIEALFFGFFGVRFTLAGLLMAALSAAAFTGVVAAVSRTRTVAAHAEEWTPRVTVARFAVASALYLFVYFAAGLSIMPFIQDFYAPRGVPPFLEIIAMQLLVRGPIFVALCAMLVQASRVSRPATILITGAAMSVLGGVAPLMVPNPFFTDAVRWAHFVEVTTSNFLFGCAVATLLSRRTEVARTIGTAPAAAA